MDASITGTLFGILSVQLIKAYSKELRRMERVMVTYSFIDESSLFKSKNELSKIELSKLKDLIYLWVIYTAAILGMSYLFDEILTMEIKFI